jgi:hypothetical protein
MNALDKSIACAIVMGHSMWNFLKLMAIAYVIYALPDWLGWSIVGVVVALLMLSFALVWGWNFIIALVKRGGQMNDPKVVRTLAMLREGKEDFVFSDTPEDQIEKALTEASNYVSDLMAIVATIWFLNDAAFAGVILVVVYSRVAQDIIVRRLAEV